MQTYMNREFADRSHLSGTLSFHHSFAMAFSLSLPLSFPPSLPPSLPPVRSLIGSLASYAFLFLRSGCCNWVKTGVWKHIPPTRSAAAAWCSREQAGAINTNFLDGLQLGNTVTEVTSFLSGIYSLCVSLS